MPNYTGCPCEGCGKPLSASDDIVVCPDCGAPYHRTCYEKLGRCVHQPAHGAYEWKLPYAEADLRTCPSCGEKTPRTEKLCRCCGKMLPPENEQPTEGDDSTQGGTFDYANMYRQMQNADMANAQRQAYDAAFGKDETLDGISCKDWATYIGPSAPAYLETFGRMQLAHSKISMSFSALLFGPFYFFYRKAWKPAFGFLAAELVLAAPTIIEMMQITNSSLAPAMSSTALVAFSRVCSVLGFALMLLRGMFGKWLYRQSAKEHIRRIQSEFPDADQRQAVLAAQGGVSFAAVFGSFMFLLLVGSAASLLLGPDLDALLKVLYG